MKDIRAAMIQDLLRLAPHITVIHHVPGRIRLRMRPSGLTAMREIDLDQMRNGIPGIQEIRVNRLVASVVIQYDPNCLPPDLWEALSRLRDTPELASEVEERLKSLWNHPECDRISQASR